VDIGIGLPNTVPGTAGGTLVDWARSAEEAGFSTLGTIGRIVYPNYEELVALSAAAAVTSRIRLTTAVLLAPLYANTVLLAKQAASLDRLSGGRLVLGLGLGGRDDDFTASGLSTRGRGRRLEQQIELMRRVWSGEKFGDAGGIGPEPARPGGPELILGGATPASFARVARLGDGWIMGGGTPEMFAQGAAAVAEAWRQAGRAGSPRTITLAYFALGPDARAQADAYLHHYYAWLGDFAARIAAGAATSAEMVRSYAAAFESSGCDEVIFMPTASRPDQVTRLAEAIA
jgi:alkanesulfonate monooxygenase SsuD/methylene tetrahydromethanopterin reductase-like flavin-dependent oxidoreductase (luciferase family)